MLDVEMLKSQFAFATAQEAHWRAIREATQVLLDSLRGGAVTVRASPRAVTNTHHKVVELLKAQGPMRARDVHRIVGGEMHNVANVLSRAVKRGVLIRAGYGVYQYAEQQKDVSP